MGGSELVILILGAPLYGIIIYLIIDLYIMFYLNAIKKGVVFLKQLILKMLIKKP